MVFRRLRVLASVHIGLIFVFSGVFFALLFRTKVYAAAAVAGLLVVSEVVALFRTVDRANRDLTRFFEAVKFGDFTQTFGRRSAGRSFRQLRSALAEVMRAFQKARAEKEEQALYLRTIVQHVAIGLLVYEPDGEVDLINNAAKRLLGVAQLKNVQALESVSPGLVRTLLGLMPRERALVRIERPDEQLQLALQASEFKLHARVFTLVSVQDIRSELEEKEIDAWQKLIRVLTHEIMNSMTPISSLAATAQDLVARGGDPETWTDIDLALRTIAKRSQGLLHFVDGYRNLMRIPKPDLKFFPARDLCARVRQLLQGPLAESRAQIECSLRPENLELLADPDLLEQVLINLLLNAADAVRGRENGRVELAAYLDERGRPVIQVRDNGVGIPRENLDKIFIPFFSTKEGGSGIGLSLSRQVMQLHNGTISVSSQPGVETVFTLRFRM
ncbi:MAG: ATP-binding protein [Candidatus Aminicenantes bacterium]|nr:ATP-binding protein [Candidatus Aminicenantes bacterium]